MLKTGEILKIIAVNCDIPRHTPKLLCGLYFTYSLRGRTIPELIFEIVLHTSFLKIIVSLELSPGRSQKVKKFTDSLK